MEDGIHENIDFMLGPDFDEMIDFIRRIGELTPDQVRFLAEQNKAHDPYGYVRDVWNIYSECKDARQSPEALKIAHQRLQDIAPTLKRK